MKTYGYSPKGVSGKWNGGGYVYLPLPWPEDIREVFPPHINCAFKEEAPAVCCANLAENVKKTNYVKEIHGIACDLHWAPSVC